MPSEMEVAPSEAFSGLYPCSTKTREVLGNPFPTPKRFLLGLRKSLGRREWISQYVPSFGGWWDNGSLLLYLRLHQLQEHRCSGANTGLNSQKLFISGLDWVWKSRKHRSAVLIIGAYDDDSHRVSIVANFSSFLRSVKVFGNFFDRRIVQNTVDNPLCLGG